MKRTYAVVAFTLLLAACNSPESTVTGAANEDPDRPVTYSTPAAKRAPAAPAPAKTVVVTKEVPAPAAAPRNVTVPAAPAPAAPAPAPAPAAVSGDLTLGQAHDGERMTTTVVEVRVGVTDSSDFQEMGNTDQAVAAWVHQCAKEDGASYNPFYWKSVDASDGEYGLSLLVDPVLKPQLSSGELRKGECVSGWVFLETPRAKLTGVRLDTIGGDRATWRVKVG